MIINIRIYLLTTKKKAYQGCLSIKTFIKKLATQGHSLSREELRSLKATYYRSALDLIDAYRADAEINGLTFDYILKKKQ